LCGLITQHALWHSGHRRVCTPAQPTDSSHATQSSRDIPGIIPPAVSRFIHWQAHPSRTRTNKTVLVHQPRQLLQIGWSRLDFGEGLRRGRCELDLTNNKASKHQLHTQDRAHIQRKRTDAPPPYLFPQHGILGQRQSLCVCVSLFWVCKRKRVKWVVPHNHLDTKRGMEPPVVASQVVCWEKIQD
jgi:hypothetical protein